MYLLTYIGNIGNIDNIDKQEGSTSAMGNKNKGNDEGNEYKENPAKDIQEHVEDIDARLWELEQEDDK